jgi:hypothetical protein
MKQALPVVMRLEFLVYLSLTSDKVNNVKYN